MGILKALDKAFTAFNEYAPKVIESMEKAEASRLKREEKKEVQLSEYKKRYVHLSNKELKDLLGKTTGLEKTAVASILRERNAKVLALKETYAELRSPSLRYEWRFLEQQTTKYGDTPGQKISKEEVDLRKRLILSI